MLIFLVETKNYLVVLSILTYFPFLIQILTYIFLLQTRTNSIYWNPMEPMNFTAVSIIIELIQFYFFFGSFLVLFVWTQCTWFVCPLFLALFIIFLSFAYQKN